MRSILFGVVLVLAACGHADDDAPTDAAIGGCDCDAPQSLCPSNACTGDSDAGPDASSCAGTCETDAAEGGLPVNAACEPTLDQCESGLTCRIRAAHDGLCRPVGTRAAGELCTGVDQCGDDMACITAEPGALRCMVVCDVAAPSVRCGADTCTPFWGADTGVCT